MKTQRRKQSSVDKHKKEARLTGQRIRRVLATTDLSNSSMRGVRHAVRLSDEFGAAVSLLHVVELPEPPTLPGMRTLTGSLQDPKVFNNARVRLKTVALRESKSHRPITPVLRSGSPVNVIITTAEKLPADLIVIATHGFTGANRLLLGSTAERVVRHAPCPVLTVPVRSRKTRHRKAICALKRIVVPIDFSKNSELALPWAASLAAKFDAELILLHVVEKFPIDYLLGDSTSDTIRSLRKQSEAELNRIAEDLNRSNRLKATTLVAEGKPFKKICGVAEDARADLIVLSTRGNTGLRYLWLGSTAERVVRHSRCPVLTVRNLPRRND